MSIDVLEDGARFTFCGTTVSFYGEGLTDCLGRGAEWANAEDDPGDELDDPATDDIEFDIDPDMLEDVDFEDNFECD